MNSNADLSGLDYRSARDYAVSFAAGLKQHEQHRDRAEQQAQQWRKRCALAEKAGDGELLAAARGELEAAEARLASLRREEEKLRRELRDILAVLRLKAALGHEGPDPDMLAAELELEQEEGRRADLATEFRSLEASAALERLKREQAGKKDDA